MHERHGNLSLARAGCVWEAPVNSLLCPLFFFLSRAWRNRRDIIRGLKVLVYRYGSRDYVDFSVRPIAYLYSHILLDFLHPLPPRCTDMAQVIMWVSVSDSLGILLVFLQI